MTRRRLHNLGGRRKAQSVVHLTEIRPNRRVSVDDISIPDDDTERESGIFGSVFVDSDVSSFMCELSVCAALWRNFLLFKTEKKSVETF